MLVWQTPRNEETGMNPAVRRVGEVTRDECVATGGAQKIECKSLVLTQVHSRSIINKSLDFWNLSEAYNPNAIIGTESQLREEISNEEVFSDDYTVFRRDRILEVEVFICVKKYIACMELWMGKDFEMIAVEVRGRNTKFTWEITGIYRAPNEDMRVKERLATRTDSLGKSKK
jgi:hypothetical protein